ncbi:MAG: ABC transporter substrate-binding protein [bacterium]|nr:ABC transporter substrate-binding protein [bacterium]
MRRRDFIGVLGGTVMWPLAAQAQQKPVVIGFLGSGSAAQSSLMVGAIKQGLRDNGLVEGKEYVFEQRWADGEYERFPAFARDLVEQKAGVIIVTTIAAARAAQRETSVIPIVMGMINDPVGSGLVASLARPGGNTTGMASLNQDITPKMVESLKLLLPGAADVVVLFNPSNPSNLAMLASLRASIGPMGIAVRTAEVGTLASLSGLLDLTVTKRPDALLVVPDNAIAAMADAIAAFGLQHRIPVISTIDELTRAGGLISYGPNRTEIYRRSGFFVKKVLDGVKPADLPIEQPTRLVLTVNLKTARSLGISIHDTILATADEVIE